jgi:hypothetical protein
MGVKHAINLSSRLTEFVECLRLPSKDLQDGVGSVVVDDDRVRWRMDDFVDPVPCGSCTHSMQHQISRRS